MRDCETFDQDELSSNGIDAVDGGYLGPTWTPGDVAKFALGEQWDERRLNALRDRDFRQTEAFSVRQRGAADDLSYAGWGLVFGPSGADPRILEALKPLIELRRSQANRRFRECVGKYAYQKGLSAIEYAAKLVQAPPPLIRQKSHITS